MNDRLMLERAARAGGYRIKFGTTGDPYKLDGINTRSWNPLADLSDATSLFLSLALIDSARFRRWYDDLRTEGMGIEEAFCRAVTYTAAEIGEGMERESA